MCQKQKAIRAGQYLRCSESEKDLVFRGLVRCGITNRCCPCEAKKERYVYVTCWRKDNSRIYIREEKFTRRISFILNSIKLPNCIVIELQKELKSAKASERKFNTSEMSRLRTEQEKLKKQIDTLFDLRLDGELDRVAFDKLHRCSTALAWLSLCSKV